MSGKESDVVYSTDPDFSRRCPRCGSQPCRCPAEGRPPARQTARIQREKKGRGGKTVTVISGLQLAPEELAALAKRLKGLCASGGTIKDGAIEIQGDHREQVAAELQKLGYRTKLSGG